MAAIGAQAPSDKQQGVVLPPTASSSPCVSPTASRSSVMDDASNSCSNSTLHRARRESCPWRRSAHHEPFRSCPRRQSSIHRPARACGRTSTAPLPLSAASAYDPALASCRRGDLSATAVIAVARRQHRALVPEVEALSGGQRALGEWRHYPPKPDLNGQVPARQQCAQNRTCKATRYIS